MHYELGYEMFIFIGTNAYYVTLFTVIQKLLLSNIQPINLNRLLERLCQEIKKKEHTLSHDRYLKSFLWLPPRYWNSKLTLQSGPLPGLTVFFKLEQAENMGTIDICWCFSSVDTF